MQTNVIQKYGRVFILAVCLALGAVMPAAYAAQPEMVRVTGGLFAMGSVAADAYDVEIPVHPVLLKSFYIGKYEVTADEYDDFCRETRRLNAVSSLLGLVDNVLGLDQRPATNVSWYDAVAYCNWLSAKEGLKPVYYQNGAAVTCDFTANGYRLPTEAEWEFAALGGISSRYYKYSGSNILSEVAWYNNNSDGRPHTIGMKKPNELGLYDMSGNAWEWCWDWFGSYELLDAVNPKGPEKGSARVARGGSWSNDEDNGRPSHRNPISPTSRLDNVGFRLARNL